MVSTLQHLLRLDPGCRLVDFGAGACKLASQLHRLDLLQFWHVCIFELGNWECQIGMSTLNIFWRGVEKIFPKVNKQLPRAGGLVKPVLCVEPSPEMLEVNLVNVYVQNIKISV